MLSITPEFAEVYANWNGLQSVCITIDIDFAPDYMIKRVVDLLDRYDGNATFFATHDSAYLQQIHDDPRFEVGTHPNLAAGSTQGNDLRQIVSDLRAAFPGCRGNRFHLLAHSYRDLATLSQMGFSYDASTLHFNCPYVLPAWQPDLQMTLLTYTWEDGICENACLPMELSSIGLHSPGIKILNFHPVNVFLNGPDSQARKSFFRDNPDLTGCPRQVAERYRWAGRGSETVLAELLEELSRRECRLLKVGELVDAFRSHFV